MPWWTVVLYVAAATATAAGIWALILTTPEPDSATPGADTKRAYRTLARHTPLTLTLAALAALVVIAFFPIPTIPAGLVLGACGIPLAVCDGFTTWLPIRVCHIAWVAAAVAVLSGPILLGATWSGVVVAAAAAGVVSGVFWLFWRLGQSGFGDVRYTLFLGVTVGVHGATTAAIALATGCIAAAIHVVVLRRVRPTGFYPWTPGLLTGSLAMTTLLAA